MPRLLKTPGSIAGHARMLIADFDGRIRDGATFELKGQPRDLRDGDMVIFNCPDGSSAGINVEEDQDGLCAHIQFEPMVSFRIGLEPVGNGAYAFRPAAHHIELRPRLATTGGGEKIS